MKAIRKYKKPARRKKEIGREKVYKERLTAENY
jgi:hypothetical protein